MNKSELKICTAVGITARPSVRSCSILLCRQVGKFQTNYGSLKKITKEISQVQNSEIFVVKLECYYHIEL